MKSPAHHLQQCWNTRRDSHCLWGISKHIVGALQIPLLNKNQWQYAPDVPRSYDGSFLLFQILSEHPLWGYGLWRYGKVHAMPPTLAHSCWGHGMGMEAVWQPSNDGSYSPRTHVIMLQRWLEINGGFLYIAKYLGLPFACFGGVLRVEVVPFIVTWSMYPSLLWTTWVTMIIPRTSSALPFPS